MLNEGDFIIMDAVVGNSGYPAAIATWLDMKEDIRKVLSGSEKTSTNKQIDVISLRDVNEILTPYTGKIEEKYLLDIMESMAKKAKRH